MDKKISLEITEQGKTVVAVLKNVLITDADQIAAVHKQISRFVKEKRPAKLIIDFECVKFFSSQLLGMLLEIRTQLKAYDGEVVISAIEPQLHRVFRITNLDKIFRFFPDKEIAVSSA